MRYISLLKNKLNSPLVTNFFSLFILQGANYLFPLLTVPYLFRTLGVETFGLINFATAFIQYFAIFTDFGFNLSATKYIAENRDDKEKVRDHFANVLGAKLILFLIGLLVLIFIVNIFDTFSVNKFVFILSYGTILGSVLLPFWLFQGMEEMGYITKITIVTRTLAIIPVFIFVKSDEDYLLVPFFYSIGAILSGVIGLYVAHSKLKITIGFSILSFSSILKTLKESSVFFISRISVSLYTVSNTFILGLVLGNIAVGYYVAAEKLYSALQSMYFPLSNALYPYIVKSKNIFAFKKIFIAVVLVNTIGVLIFIFGANFLLNVIYTKIDIQSVNVLKILFVGCLVSVPSVLLGYPLLGALGFTKYTNLTVIISSIFHVIGLVFLFSFNYITIYSVAILVVVTESLVLILRIKGVKKYIV